MMNLLNQNVVYPLAGSIAIAQLVTYGADKIVGKNSFNTVALAATVLASHLFDIHLPKFTDKLNAFYPSNADSKYSHLMFINNKLAITVKTVATGLLSELAYRRAAQKYPSGQFPKAVVYLAFPVAIASSLYIKNQGDITFSELRSEISSLFKSLTATS